jgi:hypothetical protein
MRTRTKPPKPNPDAVVVRLRPEQNEATAMAQTYLRPTVQAASTVRAFNKGKDESGPDLTALVAELSTQAATASGGDLGRAEAMLIAQAHSLDAIFGYMARRAAMNAGEYLGACETYLRLGLKAQSQCRATLETLALIKNPAPVAFVRQANIGQNVQVNNSAAAPTGDASRARESDSLQSRLLEAQHGTRLDNGTAQASGDLDSQLETVGAVHGAKDEQR